MKKCFSIILVVVITLSFLSGCTRNNNEVGYDVPDSITPLMWHVTSPTGQTMYLFGSIHVAEELIYPLPAFIMDAFARSEYLAVEIDLLAFVNDPEMQEYISARLMRQDGLTLADDIGEELVARMSEVLTEEGSGYLINMLDMMKPIFWEMFLLQIATERAGMSMEFGLDLYFLVAAAERDMEVLEVESFEKQMDMLLGLSMPLQAFLIEASLDIEQTAQELLAMYEAWKQGDEQFFVYLFSNENLGMPEELFAEYIDALLTQRDLLMVEVARQYMHDGKSVFFVVGLGHMIGKNGIVEQLRRHGYTVEQISGL